MLTKRGETMFGVFYVIAKLFGYTKDAVVDNMTDYEDRQNRKINDVAYVGKNGLQSYATGHSLTFVNSHTYQDNKTLKTIKVPLSEKDIEKERANRDTAINNGRRVYKCCDYYLPDNVKGFVYKNLDNDRLYVQRKIKSSLTNSFKINNTYYISIMPDNFGHIERDWKGNMISGDDLQLKDYVFRLDSDFWKDDNYIWRV